MKIQALQRPHGLWGVHGLQMGRGLQGSHGSGQGRRHGLKQDMTRGGHLGGHGGHLGGHGEHIGRHGGHLGLHPSKFRVRICCINIIYIKKLQ